MAVPFFFLCLVIAVLLGGALPPAGAANPGLEEEGAGLASIGGRVILSGPVPVLRPARVWKHREFCGAERVPAALRVGSGGGVADALVILEGATRPGGARAAARLTLDNRDCEFEPRVQVAPLGADLEVLTSDPVLHTAHAYLDGGGTLFHVALPVFLSRRVVRLTRPGLVRIECDVGHTWMRAFVWVTASGFAVVTDRQGRFSLAGVAPGHYRLRVWHEILGELALPVAPGSGERLIVGLEYRNGKSLRGNGKFRGK